MYLSQYRRLWKPNLHLIAITLNKQINWNSKVNITNLEGWVKEQWGQHWWLYWHTDCCNQSIRWQIHPFEYIVVSVLIPTARCKQIVRYEYGHRTERQWCYDIVKQFGWSSSTEWALVTSSGRFLFFNLAFTWSCNASPPLGGIWAIIQARRPRRRG
jgi:hypothetical protein